MTARSARAATARTGRSAARETPRRYSTLGRVLPELALISFVMNLLTLALPLVLLQVYDRILPNAALSTFALMVLGVGGALILESLLKMGRSAITGWVAARFEHNTGVAALRRLLDAPLQAFEQVGSGMHLERLNALNTVKDFYAGQALLSLLDLPFVVIFLGIIGLLGGWLVLVPLVLLVLFILMALWIGERLRRALRDRMTLDDRRVNFIIEALSGAHTLKAMAMEAQMMRRYERLQESCGAANQAVTRASASALGLGAFFSQITMVGTVAAGSAIAVNEGMTTGALAACTLLSGRALQPIQRALGVWTRFQTIQLARQRLHAVFEMEPEAPPGLPSPETVDGRLELRDVAFAFHPDSAPILRGVTMTAAPGACIGIAGGNGSGKTTLLGLMSGALKPAHGTVALDGTPLSAWYPRGLKRHVAYLPQQGELFRGTILDNITMFDPARGEDAIRQAETLGLGPIIASLPLGYDTMVGDSAGETLPRGIRQRIAVARALLTNPRVVLFDEANTAVDGTGDAAIKACLDELKGRCTLILVTHRPSLLALADRVYDLADGTLTPRAAKPGQKPGEARP
ncbi:ATP-binding cassette domain-containing protein [Roseospira marina]|uniref:ATP-binding cassette domain-containing protein n=1 Tax=Roseospira marina TaxID=140057 RepID=A0A5M6IA25_9PROT|nr:ABC transporter transmembrane domain-containing protein [Roseospira marina]KAA5605126.1 ATP-binding cassette domain-containing protein [Roseospira marina]MBB4314877.1 ATP-binding cassette subfamily C protein LapB [Roseospira marina]MBB5087877.1 ATP-binding cassette subfamily C protein LapB [Roseospira marina]